MFRLNLMNWWSSSDSIILSRINITTKVNFIKLIIQLSTPFNLSIQYGQNQNDKIISVSLIWNIYLFEILLSRRFGIHTISFIRIPRCIIKISYCLVSNIMMISNPSKLNSILESISPVNFDWEIDESSVVLSYIVDVFLSIKYSIAYSWKRTS